MENYTDTIDLINAYINKTLAEAERLAFENRLQTDAEFNSLYIEHLAILEGIKRVDLTAEIQAAKQSYIRAKWMKYIGISMGVILVSVLVYTFVFKTETSQIVEPSNNDIIEIVTDSIVVEKALEEKIEEEIIVVKQEEVETVSEEKEVVKTEASKVESQPVIENQMVEVVEEQPEIVKTQPTSVELKAFFESVKELPQIFEIDTKKDTIITGEKGTKIQIKANSFLTTGKVKIEINEFYELSDMLLANLSTKADEELLETGGMLNVKAYDGKKEIALKENKTIALAFPKRNDKEGMQLFSGDHHMEENINWTLQGNKRDLTVFSNNVIEWTDQEDTDQTLWIKEIMQDSTFEVSKEFYENFVKYKEQKLIRDIGLAGNRKVIIRKPLLEMENSPFKVLTTDSISRGGHIIRKPSKFKQKRIRRPITDLLRRSGQDKYNVFEATKLGWINCDRFVRTNKTKIKYKIKIKGTKGADLKIVFKSISSILPSKNYDDEYDFGKVPIKEAVTLIAIKEIEEKLFLAIEDTETKTRPEIDFNFKEVTVEELKEEIQKLNSEF